MEGKPSDGLTIEYSPTGRNGKATLTAKLGGDVIAVESLDLTKPQARAGFVGAVCDGRPGIDAQALGDELLRMAAELANKPDAGGKKGKRTGIIHLLISLMAIYGVAFASVPWMVNRRRAILPKA